jgi:hypothetical protein
MKNKKRLNKLKRLAEEMNVPAPRGGARSVETGFTRFVPIIVVAVIAAGLGVAWYLGLLGGLLGGKKEGGQTATAQKKFDVKLEPQGEVIQGKPCEIKATIKNITKEKITDWVSVQLENSDEMIYAIKVKLGPGESTSFTFQYTPKQSGNLSLVVGGTKTTLTVKPPAPGKLQVLDLTVAPTEVILDPDKGKVTVAITATVVNVGDTICTEDIVVYGGPEGEEQEVYRRSGVKLGPGEKAPVTCGYDITPDLVGELEEGVAKTINFMVRDKKTSVQVTGFPKFETKIVAVNPYPNPSLGELVVGDKVEIIFRVTNNGTAGGNHKVVLSIGGVDKDSKVLHVKRGESVKDNFVWYPDRNGSFSIEVDGVPWGQPVVVKNPPKISILSLDVSPKELITEEFFTAKAILQNTGEVKGGCTVEFSVDGQVIYQENVTVPAGETKEVIVQPRSKASVGTTQVKVAARGEWVPSGEVSNSVSVPITGILRPPKVGDKWNYTGGRQDVYQGTENGFDVFYGNWIEGSVVKTHKRFWQYKAVEGEIWEKKMEFMVGNFLTTVEFSSPVQIFKWPIPGSLPYTFQASVACTLLGQARDTDQPAAPEVIENISASNLSVTVKYTVNRIDNDSTWGEIAVISFSYDFSGNVTISGEVKKNPIGLLGYSGWEDTGTTATRTVSGASFTVYGTMKFSRRYGLVYLTYGDGSKLYGEADWTQYHFPFGDDKYRIIVEVPMASQAFSLSSVSF